MTKDPASERVTTATFIAAVLGGQRLVGAASLHAQEAAPVAAGAVRALAARVTVPGIAYVTLGALVDVAIGNIVSITIEVGVPY